MTADNDHDVPEWMKPLYKKQKETGTLTRDALDPDMPDWLKDVYIRKVTGELPPLPDPEPEPEPEIELEPLNIEDFVHEGELSSTLQHILSPQNYTKNAAFTKTVNSMLDDAHKQVSTYTAVNEGELPVTLTLYGISEVTASVIRHPVQLATMIAELIMLASGTYTSTSKDVHKKAVFGITETMLQRATIEDYPEIAIRNFINEQLDRVKLYGEVPPKRLHMVMLHARILILEELYKRLEPEV